ncbi:hypothetical protein V6N13_032837 [Hibiscus sabdariffa]|uniref:Uncharacterized protein n=1 Tax=Hibiscus sabdariffa TaxID=183260 RepID=A0ABR2FBY1_9ROSI
MCLSVGLGDPERCVLGGVSDEVVGLVWREEMNLGRSVEVVDWEGMLMNNSLQQAIGLVEQNSEEAAGEGGTVAVVKVELELDSNLTKDRDINLISTSAIDLPPNFDENLTIVPIVETDTIPINTIVPQVTQLSYEVVVSGGVPCKV